MERHKVFLLEDDINFGSLLKSYLELNEFTVTWATDGGAAMDTYNAAIFDLCILDVMLPHKDGFSVAAEIRDKTPHVPLVFLTAKSLREDVIKGYQAGADDYVTKPFDTEVLLFKLRAILRRGNEQNGCDDFSIGAFNFSYTTRILKSKEKEVRLSPREADLLRLLCQNVNELMPRETALLSIWKEDNYFTRRSMDVFMTRIRKLLEHDPLIELISVHGKGYRLHVKD